MNSIISVRMAVRSRAVVFLFALSFLVLANVQGSAADVIPTNYFDQGSDEVRLRIRTVEVNHLNANFWENYKAGRFKYALQDVDFVLRWVPNHPQGLMLVGAIAKMLRESSLAIRYYENALKLFPQHGITHAQYGSYLVDIGVIDEGIARLKKAIEMDQNLVAAYVWLAQAYHQSGQRELAREAGQKARDLGYKGAIPG